MWVIKLGGSLMGSPALKSWLDALILFGGGKIVIVPGGGVFADVVRDAQVTTGIDDATSHQMAVLAMDQYALLMTGLNADLVMVSSELEISEHYSQDRTLVWKPSTMILADKDLPMNWNLTSDSLAAWLATKLNAKQLLIVKSIPINYAEKMEVKDWILSGVVDNYFGEYIANKSFKTWLVGQDEFIKIKSPFIHQSCPKLGVEVLPSSQP